MASSMMPWSKEPVTRLFTVADRCRNTSRRPGFTETEHCCRPLSREHCCRPVSSEDAPEDQLGHQLAPLTHQRSLAHWESARINADVHVWSSSRRPLLHGEMHSCTRFRDVSTTLHGKTSWPSSSCDMSGRAGLACTLLGQMAMMMFFFQIVPEKKRSECTPHIQFPGRQSCQMGR